MESYEDLSEGAVCCAPALGMWGGLGLAWDSPIFHSFESTLSTEQSRGSFKG